MRRVYVFASIIAAAALVAGCCPQTCSQTAGVSIARSGAAYYDLGKGSVANSGSIRMLDGYATPRPTRLSGCVDNECFTKPLRKPVIGVPPASTAPCEPCAAPVAAPVASTCSTGDCPVLPESAFLCNPIDGVSDCFTRSEQELARDMVTFWNPGETKYGAVGEWKPSVPAAKPAEPAQAIDLPTVPGVPELPQAKAKTAQPMPPVPQVDEMTTELAREADQASALPEVEMPPKLN